MSEQQPFLMTRAEAIVLKTAQDLTGLSIPTLRRLNRKHRIGRQTTKCAPLELSYPALVMIQHGDGEALEKLRNGQRSDPDVRRYFDLLGLP